MNIQFSPPDITDLEIQEVIAAMKSGWITTGPKTKLFEKKIAEYCGTPKAVCLNSATAALELTLRVLGIGPGDEVITSAYTYTASASVINHVGAKIVLVDVAAGSYYMDYEKLAGAITEKTKAVIPVDIGGVMCDYDRLFEAVERKKQRYHPSGNVYQRLFDRPIVLADAAHSFGARYHGMVSGQAADFTCFSFHAVKNLTTAEGGAVTWRGRGGLENENLYNLFMLYSLHGQSKDALAKMMLGAWEYDVVYPAYKCNMTDITAAIGLVQLQRFDGLSEKRKRIIRKYDEKLLPLGIERLEHIGGDYEGNGHLYLMRIPGISENQRNEIIRKMAEAGIACNVHFKPLPMHTAYKNLGFDIKAFPESYKQYANEITLPLHPLLTNEEAEYVAETIQRVLKGGRICEWIKQRDIEFQRVWDDDGDGIGAIYSIIKDCGEKMFLEDGLLHWADPLPIETIRDMCLQRHVYLAVEKLHGTPMAFISITDKPSVYFPVDPGCAYIERLAVSPALWRKGVGLLCVQKAVEFCRQHQCGKLRATVYDRSDKAVAFFKAMGFQTLYSRPTKHFVNLCIEKDVSMNVSANVDSNSLQTL